MRTDRAAGAFGGRRRGVAGLRSRKAYWRRRLRRGASLLLAPVGRAGRISVGVGVDIVAPWSERAARRESARELERDQRRGEQQEHEEHDERVAVQSCSRIAAHSGVWTSGVEWSGFDKRVGVGGPQFACTKGTGSRQYRESARGPARAQTCSPPDTSRGSPGSCTPAASSHPDCASADGNRKPPASASASPSPFHSHVLYCTLLNNRAIG